MGHYCYINAHFPVAEFSDDEQTFLAELRQLLPSADARFKLSPQEESSLLEAAHKKLHIPGDPNDWRFVRQWQRNGTWYVQDFVKPTVTPPFPAILSDYDSPWAKHHLPALWLVAFTAPGRWQEEGEYWSIHQTLRETRRHVREVFGKLWSLFLITAFPPDPCDLNQLRKKAPPTSNAHKRLRSVFSLFKLRDFMSLHRLVLSRDLPAGTILELDILDYLYSGTEEEAKAKFESSEYVQVLEAVHKMDIDSLINSKALAELKDYDEYVTPWLSAGDADDVLSSYLLQNWPDDES